VREWRHGDITQKEFCIRRDIALPTLPYWVCKVKRSTESLSLIIEVKSSAATNAGHCMELHFATGSMCLFFDKPSSLL
jgi:hypothetical protein